MQSGRNFAPLYADAVNRYVLKYLDGTWQPEVDATSGGGGDNLGATSQITSF